MVRTVPPASAVQADIDASVRITTLPVCSSGRVRRLRAEIDDSDCWHRIMEVGHSELPRDGISSVSAFLTFVLDAKQELSNPVSAGDPDVRQICDVVEEHYVDDDGRPSMYQRLESALYDDAREIVTLWRFFRKYSAEQPKVFSRMLKLEHDGLTGDRHPRKVFDRSPLGIVALVVGTITIWMTVLRTFTGEDLSELLELIRFDWVAGTLWIVGLFVVLWFILKTLRNNRQVSLISTISRALVLYLGDDTAVRD